MHMYAKYEEDSSINTQVIAQKQSLHTVRKTVGHTDIHRKKT